MILKSNRIDVKEFYKCAMEMCPFSKYLMFWYALMTTNGIIQLKFMKRKKITDRNNKFQCWFFTVSIWNVLKINIDKIFNWMVFGF